MGVLNTTPRTWTTGEVVTAAMQNAEIRDPMTAMQAGWTAYTPTIGGLTTTSGTTTASYNQVGKTIDFKFQFTLGASSSVAGCTVTLPVTATADTSGQVFNASGYDSSAVATYTLAGIATSTTVVTLRVPGSPVVAIGATVPFTWATGDIITISGRYEAA